MEPDRSPRDVINLVCEECGAVEHGDGLLAKLKGPLASSHGFETRAAEVTVFGRCVHCQSDEQSPGQSATEP